MPAVAVYFIPRCGESCSQAVKSHREREITAAGAYLKGLS
jgi:hypothetical protein